MTVCLTGLRADHTVSELVPTRGLSEEAAHQQEDTYRAVKGAVSLVSGYCSIESEEGRLESTASLKHAPPEVRPVR